MKIRAFIACDIPGTVLEKIEEIRDRLKELNAEVTWTRTSGIHITLKFLGEMDEGAVDKVASAITEASKGQKPFQVAIRGSGAFPNLRNPRVIWLGVTDDAVALSGIQQSLEDLLKGLGFEPEERDFKPHLTLGRVKGPRAKEQLAREVSELRDIDLGSFEVDRVILYKSELKPTGAVYTKLREIMLQDASCNMQIKA